MAFHDVVLPDTIARGAKGGPRFLTSIIPTPGGHEKRNINWPDAKGMWDIGYGIMDKASYEIVVAFFYAQQGRAHSFKFKDFSDYTMTANSQIAIGDNATVAFQAVKTYSDGLTTYTRNLTKIKAGTSRVYLDSVEQASGWTIDNSTGIITFDVAPAAAVVIGFDCEFYNHVRFDTDELNMSLEFFDAAIIPNIPIVELRG